jgi:hypothetical protein
MPEAGYVFEHLSPTRGQTIIVRKLSATCDVKQESVLGRVIQSLLARVRDLAASRPLVLVRRVIIFVVGATIVLVGIALLVLPGPAVVVIPLGLGVLALEFTWARRCLQHARTLMNRATGNGNPNGAKDVPTVKPADSSNPGASS